MLWLVCEGVAVARSPYSLQVRDTRVEYITAAGECQPRAVQRMVALKEEVAPAPADTVTLWERIAEEEWLFDGRKDGWDSEEEVQETEDEKFSRMHPEVPVIENLEDIHKVSKVQSMRKEKERKDKMKELRQLKAKLEQERIADLGSEDINHPTGSCATGADGTRTTNALHEQPRGHAQAGNQPWQRV